jgi:hypothetical protein
MAHSVKGKSDFMQFFFGLLTSLLAFQIYGDIDLLSGAGRLGMQEAA